MDVAENTILDWYNVSDQKVHVYFFLCGHHTRFIYFSFGSLVHVCKSRRLIKGLTGLKESQLCHKSHFDSSDSLCDRHSVNTHFIISRPWPTWTSKKGVSSPTNTHTHKHSFFWSRQNELTMKKEFWLYHSSPLSSVSHSSSLIPYLPPQDRFRVRAA